MSKEEWKRPDVESCLVCGEAMADGELYIEVQRWGGHAPFAQIPGHRRASVAPVHIRCLGDAKKEQRALQRSEG
jgi:hypothetical protein